MSNNPSPGPTPVAAPTAVRYPVPNIPANAYQLLSDLADAVDTANTKLNGHATKVSDIASSTDKAVTNVTSNSQGQATDALASVWQNSQTDLNRAHDPLTTITSKDNMGGTPNPLWTVLNENKAAIQNGLIALANLQQQNQQNASTMTSSLNQQLEQWKQDLDALDSAMTNVNMAIEAIALGICRINDDFSANCTTGFVPGGPLLLFTKRAFDNQSNSNPSNTGGSGSNDPVDRIENALGRNSTESVQLISDALDKNIDLNYLADLLERGISGADIQKLIDNGVDFNLIKQLETKGGDATYIIQDTKPLLDKNISGDSINVLLKDGANLKDVATQVDTLKGVNSDLINGWIKNGTDLKDAIAIQKNYGIDLNLIGTSSQVGDFTNLANATPDEIVSRIPKDAKILNWRPDPPGTGTQDGMKFQWKDTNGDVWNVRMHGPNFNAPVGSYSRTEWIMRVIRGTKYMDAAGNYYPESEVTQRNLDGTPNPAFNEAAMQKTHIHIQTPTP